jgi:hypothetical protein
MEPVADARELLKRLAAVMLHFDATTEKEKQELLLHLSAIEPEPKELIRYHHVLLFLSAHPQSTAQHALVQSELNRMGVLAQANYNGKSTRRRIQLTNSGIRGTALHVCFSFDLVKWLEEKYPRNVSIFSCDADAETIKSVFLSGLHRLEADRFREDSFTLPQLIRRLRPKSADSDLHWLLQFIDHIPVTHDVRSHLYDSLKLFITVTLGDHVPSLSTARSLPRRLFFHKTALKKQLAPAAVLEQRQISAYKLSPPQKEQIIETARMTLCSLLRETDPVTHANVNEVELFDMGRGIDIALYPMIHEKKLSLESYIGYMAFKNRVPIAYGGGWIFLHRSRIGVNIFPSLRGGESSYLFLQILRIYRIHYRVKKFLVEPYQIGKNNAEGLRSGAYWFYYRMGFRSVQKELAELAEKEFGRLSIDKKYRPPLSVMKKLAGVNMELDLFPGTDYPDEPPENISQLTTQYINTHHGGKRTDAVLAELANLKKGKSEREAILNLQRNSKWLKQVKEHLASPSAHVKGK